MDHGTFTGLLRRASEGEGAAKDRLFSRVYDELRRRAGAQMRRERRDHTLQPTALVHEAYMRLVGSEKVEWNDRTQFFRVAARSMRQVLVDHARAHGAEKRGGGRERVPLATGLLKTDRDEIDLVDLNEAMTKLAEFNPSTSFTAWMSQIVRFVALNEARRRQRQGASLREHAREGEPGEGRAPSMLTDAAFDQRVSGLLNGLDDTARACLVLRGVHGLAYGEIATALNIPEGTAMSHVHRARTALRTQLAPGEGRSS